jgi:hypothetical protein
MSAVAAGGAGEVGPVVQQEGDIAGLHHGPQDIDRAADGIIIHILQPQLHGADIPGIERRGQAVPEEGRVEPRRRHEVGPARGVGGHDQAPGR